MCGVKADIRNRGQATAVQQNRYVLRKDDKDWVKKNTQLMRLRASNKEKDVGKLGNRLWIRTC